MPPAPISRRAAPSDSLYLRRKRRLMLLLPLATLALMGGGMFWWLGDLEGLQPRWRSATSSAPQALPLTAEEREILSIQLELLQTQWRQFEKQMLNHSETSTISALSPALALALQPARNLADNDLRRRVETLTKALDDKLLAQSPVVEHRRTGAQRLLPVAGVQPSSDFGLRADPFTRRLAVHNGIDFVARIGSPILAVEDGEIKSAGLTPQFGWSVEVDHGHGLTTRYAHALRLTAVVGQKVREGQKIAEVGSSGRSTGPHLHFEVRYNGVPLNPRRYLALR